MLAKKLVIYYIIVMKTNLFSERLKELRIKKKLTQGELGELLGYNKTAICDWETRGKEPRFDVLIKLCNIFKVSSDFLLGIKN